MLTSMERIGSQCDWLCSRCVDTCIAREVATLFQGKQNIFVSNAGKVEFEPTIEFSAEDLSTVMATNLEAAYQLSQLGHPLLKATVGGYLCWDYQVIAIDGGSSVNGFYPLKDHQKAAETVHAGKC
ncbi:hypothetical protein ACLOJK_021802 [Asimina triloba]